jgi:sensor histidine kinase YesM
LTALKKISAYWRFQLIGWAIFTLIDTVLASLHVVRYAEAGLMYGRVVLVTLMGVTISHLMKGIIHRTKLLEKTIGRQLIYLFVLTFAFTAVYFGLWIVVYFVFDLGNVVEKRSTYFATFYWVAYGLFVTIFVWNLIFFFYHYVQRILANDKQKASIERNLWEMEAKALRSQMNPHFIFNCMNSIKSLIQKEEDEKALSYLTSFSDLFSTVFKNSEKREVSLADEIETCRLYLKLESMRFGRKLSYEFLINESIDIGEVKIPPLIVQPFIENAIWHGLMPKEEGGQVTVNIQKNKETIYCIVEDNGIGRELSINNKLNNGMLKHESKGINLTRSRMKLDNILSQRKTTINIIDKKNNQGQNEGTKVILQFNTR